ncbi:MAG TPA: hypothetical protein DDY13_05860 [Cytophagales bacterium]|jgi:K+-sensing histidine kinase KdpD|nr:hypothetical protein [Cytophagales bacterium]
MEGEWVVFSCKDTGPGLKKEEPTKLFSKFNKRSNTPTGGKGQTGLGLYLVNTYQKAMNGKVEFISGDDKGVTVSLIFKKA